MTAALSARATGEEPARERHRPRVSVVIVTHNDEEKLVAGLRALRGQSYPGDATEIVVVDDGSTDRTADRVRDEFPEVKLIRKVNEGADLSRNRGIDVSSGEIVAFLDADCVAAPDWLAALVASLGRRQGSAVGGRVVHRGGFWQRLIGIADFGEYQGTEIREAAALPTCNMGLKRAVIGGLRFDPDLARAGGDTLFAAGLGRNGVPLIYDPTVVVSHVPAAGLREMLARSRRYGRSFVEARKIDPTLRYARFVRAGMVGVVAATLGRTLLDWLRLLRFRRGAGFSRLELPAAMAALLLRRMVSIPEAVRALRGRPPAVEERR